MTSAISLRKILVSLGMLVFVGAIAWGATGAFFSDTETSTGNTFSAGDIDLQIDNESYVTNAAGVLVASAATSWNMTDLIAGTHKFFDFSDVKPGDVGEDTISIHVGSNDAWMCAAARITADDDNDITEPEDEAGGPVGQDGTADGDLDSEINFAFWADDGDNVLEVGENIFLNGPLSDLEDEGQITLADSQSSILGATTPIPGDTTFYIGKAWCVGVLGQGTVAQDGLGKTGTNGPLVRGTGVTCDGSGVGNIAQTDSVEGDLQFYATQSRNNSTFTCGEDYDPTWPEVDEEPIGWVEEGVVAGGDASIVADESTVDGDNVLALTTINDVNSRVRYTYDVADIDVSAFTGFSYDSKQVSAADTVNGNASFRLVVDLDGNLLTLGDVVDVTYEPYYNIAAHNSLNDASITPAPGAWQNWAATQTDGKFWAGGVTTVLGPSEGAGGAYATNFTIAQLDAAYPNAKILGISIGMGTYNVNQVILVDNLIYNGTTLGFE